MQNPLAPVSTTVTKAGRPQGTSVIGRSEVPIHEFPAGRMFNFPPELLLIKLGTTEEQK